MPVSPSREAAYRILRRVESGGDYAVDLLQAPQVSRLKEVDQRLVTEIVMGTLRRRGELDHWLVKLSGKPLKYFDPEVATILRLSLYQILFLQKIPKSAIVNEAVDLTKAARKRSAAGLVNAVLRKCEISRQTIQSAETAGKSGELDAATKASAIHSLPIWLAARWERNFGPKAMESLAASSVLAPPTTLRIALSEADREEVQRQLLQEGISSRFGRYSPQALVVESVESGSVQSSSTFREGRAVIQDEASQLVASLLAPRTGDRVLDLCAAPGIKAGGLATAMAAGLLIACDLSARRLRTMERLLPKALPPDLHLHLVRLDATKELPFGIAFERILVDAPCSGTGTLARNPEIKWRLDPSDLLRLAELQTRILRNAVQALSPRGRLVYSTCSLEPEENEQVVEKVLHSEPGLRMVPGCNLSQEFPALSTLFDSQGYFHTRPDLHDVDGFFAAVIQRDR